MPKKKHPIQLRAEERVQLETILRKGKASAHCQRQARVLLLADTDGPEGGWSDSRIASAGRLPTLSRYVPSKSSDRRAESPILPELVGRRRWRDSAFKVWLRGTHSTPWPVVSPNA